VGFKPHRANAATLARKKHISVRVAELQEEQLAIHQHATAAGAANKQVTIESLIAEAEAARAKAMSEKGGAAAAVSAHSSACRGKARVAVATTTSQRNGPLYRRKRTFGKTMGDIKPFGQFASRVSSDPKWQACELDASHSPNVTAPMALVEVSNRANSTQVTN
jgi:hypothetical protein